MAIKDIDAIRNMANSWTGKPTLEAMMDNNKAFRDLMLTNKSFKNSMEDIEKMKRYLDSQADKKKATEELNRMAKGLSVEPEKKPINPRPSDYKKALSDMEKVISKDYLEMINRIIRKDESMIKNEPIKPVNSMTSATSSGGYLVPEELHEQIVNAMYDFGTIMAMADVIEVDGTSVTIPVAATVSTADWVDEDAAFTVSSPTVGHIKLTPGKCGCVTKVSEELFFDSGFDVKEYISTDAGMQLGRIMETEFINGTLSHRPTGILNDAEFALTSSVTGSFNFADIKGLFSSVKQAYRNNAAWVISDDETTIQTMIDLKDASNNRIFKESNEPGILGYVLGKPVKVSEAMPAITSSAKGVLFGDYSYYKIGTKPIVVQEVTELYAAEGNVGYKTYLRADGKLSVPEAVKHMAIL